MLQGQVEIIILYRLQDELISPGTQTGGQQGLILLQQILDGTVPISEHLADT